MIRASLLRIAIRGAVTRSSNSGTQHLGYEFNPRLDVAEIYSSKEGKMVTNNDSRTYLISGNSNQYASYNGLALKKGIDESWLSPYETEPDKRILRYADVLLMYAEAKMELNEIDDSVLEAINRVRARAYGVEVSATGQYPAVAEREQTKLRTIIRTERRMAARFRTATLPGPLSLAYCRKGNELSQLWPSGKEQGAPGRLYAILVPRCCSRDRRKRMPRFQPKPSKGSPHFSSRRPTNSRRGSSSPPKCTCGRSRTKLLRSCPISKTIPDIDPFPNDENRRPGTSVPGLFVYTDAHAIRHMPIHSDRIYRADNRLTAPSSFFAYGP